MVTDADLDKTIAVLLGVKETRKTRGRPPKQGQPTYADVVSKSSAAAQASNASTKKKDGTKKPAKAPGNTQAKKEENAVLQMRKEILELRKEIDELKKLLAQIQINQIAPTATQTLRTVNVAASDAQERARRSKNVIIRGIQPAYDEDSTNAVRTFLAAVCPTVNVDNAKLQRLQNSRPKGDEEPQGNRNPAPSVLVVLNSVEEQQIVLKAARHHLHPDYQGVFAHEDRTRAQQLQYSECAKKAKDKNRRLEAAALLDQPFRFVVRGDRVRCIDATQSSVNKKSIYVDERKVQLEIQQRQRLNDAISSGHVADTRKSNAASGSTAASSGEA